MLWGGAFQYDPPLVWAVPDSGVRRRHLPRRLRGAASPRDLHAPEGSGLRRLRIVRRARRSHSPDQWRNSTMASLPLFPVDGASLAGQSSGRALRMMTLIERLARLDRDSSPPPRVPEVRILTCKAVGGDPPCWTTWCGVATPKVSACTWRVRRSATVCSTAASGSRRSRGTGLGLVVVRRSGGCGALPLRQWTTVPVRWAPVGWAVVVMIWYPRGRPGLGVTISSWLLSAWLASIGQDVRIEAVPRG